jgi:hypothetical protein
MATRAKLIASGGVELARVGLNDMYFRLRPWALELHQGRVVLHEVIYVYLEDISTIS